MSKQKLKVAVGMSGGVDSSVSAWLLKKQGYEVAGFFLKFWSDPTCNVKRENSCCDAESLKNAQTVAEKLGIQLHILDVKKIFKKVVVDSFINDYKNLTTPNPCVGCNKFIKFGWFLDFAKEAMRFDKIATGHYAQIKKDKEGVFHLLAGKDKTKDQSYFLHQLGQNQLSQIIFPVGEMAKKEVFKIAKAEKLLPKGKKESQEICFIQDKDYREFLRRHLPKKYFVPGDIVKKNNEVIGRHQGLINYTIGQRKGIGQDKIKNENKTPLYVAGFNAKNNRLIVGAREDVFSQNLLLSQVFWISETAEKAAFTNKNLTAKIRYRHAAAPCLIELENKKIRVRFADPQWAITPGQSVVFYQGEEVLGGGVIEK